MVKVKAEQLPGAITSPQQPLPRPIEPTGATPDIVTSDAQDSDAPPGYEEGILTPSTYDDAPASPASTITETAGPTAHLHDEVPQQKVPADEYPHMDLLSRVEDWRCHEDILAEYEEGTGLWVFENPKVREWMEGAGGTCCLYGPDSIGKTTLAALITNHLHQTYTTEDTAIASIFIDDRKPRHSRDPNSSPLFGHLVHQLLRRPLAAQAYENLKAYLDTQPAPVGHEFTIFQKIAENYQKVFVVIDKLEDYPEEQVTNFFKAWQSLPETGKFRLLVTCGHRTLRCLDDERVVKVVVLEIEDDVRKFVEARIRRDSRLLEYIGTEFDRVVEEIVDKAGGIIFSANLFLRFLDIQSNQVELDDALLGLTSVPWTMIPNILRATESKKEAELSRVILLCTAFSPVALTCEEITQMILTFAKHDTQTDPVDADDVKVALNAAVQWGLVVVELKRGGYVRLTNRAVKYGADPDFYGRISGAHAFLSRGCSGYLSNKVLGAASEDGQTEDPVLTYAVVNWERHAQRAESDDLAYENTRVFIQQDDVIHALVHLQHGRRARVGQSPENLDCVDQEYKTSSPHPGHREAVLAAYFGLTRALKDLTAEHAFTTDDIARTIKNNAGQTLFHIAAGNDHAMTVRWILTYCKNQVDINHQCTLHHQTALTHACKAGSIATLQILLFDLPGLNPNLTDLSGRTALHHAIQHGHIQAVDPLLTREDVNPNLRDLAGHSPLMLAVLGGNVNIVRKLLERKDVDLNVNAGWETPLIQAVKRRDLEILKMLLQRSDVDVNIRTSVGTPLGVARMEGDGRVVSMLEAREGINLEG